VEELERSMKRAGRITAAVVKSFVESVISSAFKLFDEKHLRKMIREDKYLIKMVLANLKSPDRRKREAAKVGLGVFAMAKQLASMLPPAVVRKYLSIDYAVKYMEKKAPHIVKVIESEPKGKEWFKNQLQEIYDFLYKPSHRFGTAPALQQARGSHPRLFTPHSKRAFKR